MKLNQAKGAATVVAEPAKVPTKGTRSQGAVISRINSDRWVTYVARRIPAKAILAKSVGMPIPRMSETGFLLVTGDKPGVLVHRVQWDGMDVYQRDNLFGSLKALNSTKGKNFTAAIVSRKALVQQALKFGQFVSVRSVKNDTRHEAALLNDWKEPYVAAVTITAEGKLAVLNMEHPKDYNRVATHYEKDKQELDSTGQKRLRKALEGLL